jgi:hypothetical protein
VEEDYSTPLRLSSKSSWPLTLTNTIHLRDFVDGVVNDPTRADTKYLEIQTDINIFEEDRFYSTNVIVEESSRSTKAL